MDLRTVGQHHVQVLVQEPGQEQEREQKTLRHPAKEVRIEVDGLFLADPVHHGNQCEVRHVHRDTDHAEVTEHEGQIVGQPDGHEADKAAGEKEKLAQTWDRKEQQDRVEEMAA